MIQVRVRKSFPARPDSVAYSLDIEFQAAAGVTVLFGPSGSGKTLTLDMIAGFVRPDQGRILLDDEILYDGSTGVHLPPQGRHCGYVFQNYALFPHMTLRQNLAFAAERAPRLERHRRVNDLLDQFRLTEAAGRRPHEVSGGQRQRCSIARALIGGPKLLLLDEPTQGLDAPLRAELYEVLRQVRDNFRTPALLVTHDLEECFELGDEMLILNAGKIVQSGSPRKALEHPANAEVARLLGGFNLFPGEILSLDPARNSSRVRVGSQEIEGPYFPGKLLGDRVTLCIRSERIGAVGKNGRLGPNQMAAALQRVIDRPQWVRLEFRVDDIRENISVDLPRAEYDRQKANAEWAVEFPRTAVRVL